ncbi:MAG: TM2 domain-containing protein [Spirochaetaceae bacterium]|nr:TM2 domain-containing protein [Spirochaetaceae bacterium]
MSSNFEKGSDEVFCRSCGSVIKKEAEICPKCGVRQKAEDVLGDVSKKWLVALLLAIFLGTLGVHRFYVGKIGTGILMILTLGGCGIWTIIDIILIATGSFKDVDGKPISVKA